MVSMETSTLRKMLSIMSATIPVHVGGVECGRAGCSGASEDALLSTLLSEPADEGRGRAVSGAT